MARRRRRSEEPKDCGVLDCENEASRSLPTARVKRVLEDLKTKSDGRRLPLCRDHYREFRKAGKRDRKLERLSWE